MTHAGTERFRAARLAVAALLAAHLVWIEYAVLTLRRFTAFPGGRFATAGVIGLVLGAAIFALVRQGRSRVRPLGFLFVALALFAIIRFDRAEILERWQRRGTYGEQIEALPHVVTTLRELAAAQEQYRITHHRYTTSVDSLAKWFTLPPRGILTLRARGDTGWSGQLRYRASQCGIWVRDSTLRIPEASREGVPGCAGPNLPVRLGPPTPLLAAAQTERAFTGTEAGGRWQQHRGDAGRTGTVAQDSAHPGYRWTTRVGGELLASPAIAGNQVFVGAQGNGEFAALSLDSGLIRYRLRLPNWMHHEPVVTSELVIVPLGNNENPFRGDTAFGSPPSGVVAYERRSGVERWRRYARASVMTSPVVVGNDSLVAVTANSREALAWHVADGRLAWRTMLPNATRMGNPLVLDSLLIIGIEPASVCALNANTGRLIYCRQLEEGRVGVNGAGHASAAAAGTTVLQVYDRGYSPLSLPGLRHAVKLVLGDSSRRRHTAFAHTGEMVIVALDAATGRQMWSVPLGPGTKKPVGHFAGTPTVVGNVAYLTGTLNGEVIALDIRDGRLLWRSAINPSRSSVLVAHGLVLSATTDSGFVVLDAANGRVQCRQRLPGASDRAGPTLSGNTAVLALRNGMVLARPLSEWLACRA